MRNDKLKKTQSLSEMEKKMQPAQSSKQTHSPFSQVNRHTAHSVKYEIMQHISGMNVLEIL